LPHPRFTAAGALPDKKVLGANLALVRSQRTGTQGVREGAHFDGVTSAVLIISIGFDPLRRAHARSAPFPQNQNFFRVSKAPDGRAARLCAQARSAEGYIEDCSLATIA
jgi:hypothetical protein